MGRGGHVCWQCWTDAVVMVLAHNSLLLITYELRKYGGIKWIFSVPLLFLLLVWCSGVGLSGADKQLVPADNSFPHVHLIQPDVGFPYQRLLHELASIGHQEKL